MVFAPNFGDLVGTYEDRLPLSECRYSHNSFWRWWGTPYHFLAEMNSFNLFALSGSGDLKCSFSAHAHAIGTTCTTI